jgi:hypothetical protein
MIVPIKIAKPELASKFIEESYKNSVNGVLIGDYKSSLASGSFDDTVNDLTQDLGLEFNLSDKPTLQQLIKLNELSFKEACNSDFILKGNQEEKGKKKLSIGKELYELLEPLRQHEKGKLLILERELWDYLSLGLFRNFVLARWEGANKTVQFLKRTLISHNADSHPPFTSRALHSLYRLYWAYSLVKDEPKEIQLILFRTEQALQDYLQRRFFFNSSDALRASLNYCKNQNIYGNTEQVKRLVRLHKALNEAQFTSQLNKGEYLELLDSSIPKGTLSEILKLEKSRTSV